MKMKYRLAKNEDLVQIITVFSCKIQGKRKNKTKRMLEEFSQKIQEINE